MKNIITGIANRFKEPSSYAGFAGLLGLAGIQLPDGIFENIVFILSGISGVISVVLKEKK